MFLVGYMIYLSIMHIRQMKGTYPTRSSRTRYICKNFKAVQIFLQCTLAEKVSSHKKNFDQKLIFVTLVVIFK